MLLQMSLHPLYFSVIFAQTSPLYLILSSSRDQEKREIEIEREKEAVSLGICRIVFLLSCLSWLSSFSWLLPLILQVLDVMSSWKEEDKQDLVFQTPMKMMSLMCLSSCLKSRWSVGKRLFDGCSSRLESLWDCFNRTSKQVFNVEHHPFFLLRNLLKDSFSCKECQRWRWRWWLQ
jgi:hypothetical protein